MNAIYALNIGSTCYMRNKQIRVKTYHTLNNINKGKAYIAQAPTVSIVALCIVNSFLIFSRLILLLFQKFSDIYASFFKNLLQSP